jgi:hypothetical protein
MEDRKIFNISVIGPKHTGKTAFIQKWNDPTKTLSELNLNVKDSCLIQFHTNRGDFSVILKDECMDFDASVIMYDMSQPDSIETGVKFYEFIRIGGKPNVLCGNKIDLIPTELLTSSRRKPVSRELLHVKMSVNTGYNMEKPIHKLLTLLTGMDDLVFTGTPVTGKLKDLVNFGTDNYVVALSGVIPKLKMPHVTYVSANDMRKNMVERVVDLPLTPRDDNILLTESENSEDGRMSGSLEKPKVEHKKTKRKRKRKKIRRVYIFIHASTGRNSGDLCVIRARTHKQCYNKIMRDFERYKHILEWAFKYEISSSECESETYIKQILQKKGYEYLFVAIPHLDYFNRVFGGWCHYTYDLQQIK